VISLRVISGTAEKGSQPIGNGPKSFYSHSETIFIFKMCTRIDMFVDKALDTCSV